MTRWEFDIYRPGCIEADFVTAPDRETARAAADATVRGRGALWRVLPETLRQCLHQMPEARLLPALGEPRPMPAWGMKS